MIVIDIEAVPDPNQPRPTRDDIKKNLVDPLKIQAELDRMWLKRATDPSMCMIICITASRWDVGESGAAFGDPELIKQWYHRNDPHSLLRELQAWMNQDEGHTLVGHNALDYDFRAIAWAAMRYGMYDLARAFTSTSKWGDRYHKDTMHALPGWNSLEKMCRSLNIPHASPGAGSEVYDWWFTGKDVNIRQHGIDDLVAQNILSFKLHQGGLLRVER